MNKKGAALPLKKVAEVVLGLVVLGGILSGIIITSKDVINEKFFGGKGIFNYIKELFGYGEQFIPGPPPLSLDPEGQRVVDSANALVCAINTISTKDFDTKNSNVCPQENIFFGDQNIKYGNVTLNCKPGFEKEFKLSNNRADAINQLTRAILNCWRMSDQASNNKWCNTIDTSSLNDQISYDDIISALKHSGEAGKYAIGQYWFDLQNIQWDLNQKIISKNSPLKIIIYSDNAGLNEVHIDDYNDAIDVVRNYPTDVKDVPAKCEIIGFELPQEINPEDQSWIEWTKSWITNANDPKYLIYYESFPKGEEAHWQISQGSFLTDVVFWGGLMNAIPFVGPAARGVKTGVSKIGEKVAEKVFSKAAAKETTQEGLALVVRESGQEVGKTLTREAATELAEVFTREGYERLLKADLLYRQLINDGVPDNVAESVAKSIFERSARYRMLGKSASEAVDQAKDDVLQHLDDLKNIPGVDVNVLSSSINKNFRIMKDPLDAAVRETLERQQVAKNFFANNLIDMVDDGTGTYVMKEIKRDVVEKMMIQKAKRETALELSETAQQQLNKKSLSYFDDIVVPGIADEASEEVISTGVLGLGKAAAKRFTDDFVKLGKEIADNLNFDGIIRFVTGLTDQQRTRLLIRLNSKGGFKQLAKELNPIQIGSRSKNSFFVIPGEVILRTLGASFWKTGKLSADATYQLAWRSRVGRYIAAYIIAEELAKQDANNMKYLGQGYNSLIVNQPYIYDANSVFQLHQNAQNYFVNLCKNPEDCTREDENSRFFFASPCKTDLTVEETMCTCELDSGDYLLNGNPVEPEYIGFNDNSRVSNVFTFDQLNNDQKYVIKEDCVTGNWWSGIWKESTFRCYNIMFKDPEVYNNFIGFFYKEFYKPIFGLIKNNNLFDELDKQLISYNNIYYVKPSLHENFYAALENTLSNKNRFNNLTAYNLFLSLNKFTPELVFVYTEQVTDPEARINEHDVYHNTKFTESLYNSLIDDNINKSRRQLLSFDKFKQISEDYFDSPERIAWLVNHLYNEEEGMGKSWFLNQDFVVSSTRKSFFNYKVIDDSTVDFSRGVKNCNVASSFGDIPEDIINIKGVSGKAKISIPCVNVIPNRITTKYAGTFNGYNYCYSGDHTWITVWKWVFQGTAIAIDVGVGLTGVGLIVEAPVAVATGSLAAYGSKLLDEKAYWPNH